MRKHPSRDVPKELLVEALLANDTYMVDSGLYRQLYAKLMSLSRVTLGQLKIIVDMRIIAAERKAVHDMLHPDPSEVYDETAELEAAALDTHGQP